MLSGLMQDRPLLISSLIEHAAKYHPAGEVVSRSVEGPIHRCTYGDIQRRAKQVANALSGLGIAAGDRVGTLAWNGYRHMELYFGVSGIGAVLHTVNPRLFPEQVEYIVNHAEDLVLFFDLTFAPLVEKLAPQFKTVKAFVAMTDRAHMPDTKIPNLLCYEELVGGAGDRFDWPVFDENTASSLCYTSGTTGHPKGVLYSHRSTVLHSLAVCAVDGLAMSSRESVLAVVPMFHDNAWGMPYAGPMCGAKLVLPGAALDGRSIYELMKSEQVTLALGVPTVWMMLINHLETTKVDAKQELVLERVVIGGSAAPRAMCEKFASLFGASVVHAWGMTETSPIGTVCTPLPKHRNYTLAQRLDLQSKQGRPLYGVDLKIVDVDGRRLPHDGTAFGHLMIRGPWITSGYFREDGDGALDSEGYFDTGDVATIDADGYMQIADRAKDVIKSGGEWISSIDLENAAVGHPAVAEAAVIGIPDEKWQERPLLIIVARPGRTVSGEDLLAFLRDRVAKWWVPDQVIFVDQLPHTATGKLQKLRLRQMYAAGELSVTQ